MEQSLLLFCVEGKANSKKKQASDQIYINQLLDHYFTFQDKWTIRVTEMGVIGAYKNRPVVTRISELTQQFQGPKYICYVIDTDNHSQNYEQRKLKEDIQYYCASKSYYCLIFCSDIETVLLGTSISDKDKTERAKAYANKNEVTTLNSKKLLHPNPTTNGTSNFLYQLYEIIPPEFINQENYPSKK